MNTLTRVAVHTVVILLAMHLLAFTLQERGEGFRALFAVLSAGAYIPFSLIMAASIADAKAIVLGSIGCLLLTLWPIDDVQTLSGYLVPIGAGIVAAQFMKAFMRDDAQHAPPEPPRQREYVVGLPTQQRGYYNQRLHRPNPEQLPPDDLA